MRCEIFHLGIASLLFSLSVQLPLTAQVIRTTHGDTTIILTKGNGVWGAPRTAVELVRIGGATTKETTFGHPDMVTTLPNGGVVFFDDKALDGPTVRLFDANGKFVTNIGRVGSGPGEFRPQGIDIEVSADGRIWIADVWNARVNVYGPNGKYQSEFRIPAYSWTRGMLHLKGDGGGYLTVATTSRVDGKVSIGLRHLEFDSLGRVTDSVDAPPGFRSSLLSSGRVVVPSEDRIALIISAAHGIRQVTMSALDLPRVRFTAEERARNEANAKRVAPVRGSDPKSPIAQAARAGRGPLPEFRPTFDWISVSGDNRIWMRRDGPPMPPATVSTPWVYDAFDAQGTFLGEIHLPRVAATPRLSFLGDVVWAMMPGIDGEEFLVKYRIR